jgi:DNA-binding MarR family transcriptional regulator
MTEIELRERVQAFVRSFGLLNQERTPCGRPLPTSHAHALQVLGQEQPITQQVLAERLRLDKSTTSRLITQLGERGWVERGPNPANRREVRLSLTPAGQGALESILQASADRYRAMLGRIPPEKRAGVLEALDVLTAATAGKE